MHGRNAERNKGLLSGGVRWVKSTVVRVEMKCVPSTTQSLCEDEGGEEADWTVTRGWSSREDDVVVKTRDYGGRMRRC